MNNEIIIINNMEFKVKEVNCTCTIGKSHYIRYYKENDCIGTLLYGSNKEVIKNKLEKLSKKEIISNISTMLKEINNKKFELCIDNLPF